MRNYLNRRYNVTDAELFEYAMARRAQESRRYNLIQCRRSTIAWAMRDKATFPGPLANAGQLSDSYAVSTQF